MVNKVILMGFVGKEPEVKYTQSGSAVATFSVATSEKFKNKEGQWQNETEWHNVVVWGKRAEVIKDHVHKGSQLYVEGKIKTRSWEKDGKKNYRTEIIASDFQFVGKKGEAKEPEEKLKDLPPFDSGDSIPF